MSRVRKEILIKVVEEAIPIYMMCVFRLPTRFIEEIHTLPARFWWGSIDSGRKMHWHSWESLCMPKPIGRDGFP